MKYLGYKSIDSLLKRESTDVLLVGAHILESTKWQRSFMELIKKRSPNDFEMRTARVVLLDEARWSKAASKYEALSHHNVVMLREAGVIAVLPLPVKQLQGVAMVVLPLILHYLNELRVYSSHAKLQQVSPLSKNLTIASQPVHWRVVHQHFGAQALSQHPELFGPYVQADDLAWLAAEDVLTKIHPELSFWQGVGFVGSHQDHKPVSFNVLDAAINFCNQLPYDHQSTHYLHDNLHTELFRRYLQETPLHAELVRQLDQHLAEQEPFGPLLEAWG